MIYYNEKVLLLALETTYGVAPVLAAANAILAKKISIKPMEGQDKSRELDLPYMGAGETIPVGLHTKMSFTIELTPSGTAGTAPVVGLILRALGCAETIVPDTSVTYNPVTRGHESVAVHLWIGDTRYALIGTRGTGKFRVDAQDIPSIEVELTGLWSAPTEAVRVVPDLEDQLAADIHVATTANTPGFSIHGIDLVMRSFSLDLGNKVEPRFLIGSDAVLIAGRDDMIETTVEAVALTTLDPFALANARTKVPVALTHGTSPGKRFSLSVAQGQMQRLQGIEEQQGIAEWPLRIAPKFTNGNDQWSLTFT